MKRTLLPLCFLLPILLGCAARETEIGDFKVFTSKDGRFTAAFPGDPVPTANVEKTVAGDVTIHSFRAQPLPATEYIVAYTDAGTILTKEQMKSFDAEKGLVGAREGIAGATQSRVVKETKISLDKWPGREWELEGNGSATGAAPGNEDFRWRCYYVGARQYQICIGWQKGREPSKELIDKFLNSLRILPE